MKKILIVLLCLLIPATAFASLFKLSTGISFGTDWSIQQLIESDYTSSTPTEVVNDIAFGLDVNAKLSVAYVDTKLMIGDNSFSGRISAGVALDILMFRAKVGLGWQYLACYEDDTVILGNKYGHATSINGYADAPFDIQVELDLVLGDLYAGVYATLPTSVTINNGKWDSLVTTVTDGWGNAKVGALLGINII